MPYMMTPYNDLYDMPSTTDLFDDPYDAPYTPLQHNYTPDPNLSIAAARLYAI